MHDPELCYDNTVDYSMYCTVRSPAPVLPVRTETILSLSLLLPHSTMHGTGTVD
jgi:hypothetical protein